MAYTTIDDPSAHFQTATWSGSGGTQSITFNGNSDMKPDWTWSKGRTIAFNYSLQDSSRGIGSSGKTLSSNTNAQDADINDYMMTFDTDGFSVGAGDAGFNASNDTYVSWCWKANGGTTSTNSDGDIDSTVQANTTAGFSIILDSPPNTTARNIGHGLGKTPTFIIRRNRNRTEDWRVFFQGFGSTGAIILNNEGTYNSSTTALFTGVAASTFGVGTDFSVNGGYNYVTYCFTDIQGFSQLGAYIGNGNAEGPFIYTGFKPAWVIIKANSNYKYWNIFDNQRNTSNAVDKRLTPSLNAVEDTVSSIDFNSNGFKIRNSGTTLNESGTTISYFAIAEQPFVTSSAVPTTAR